MPVSLEAPGNDRLHRPSDWGRRSSTAHLPRSQRPWSIVTSQLSDEDLAAESFLNQSDSSAYANYVRGLLLPCFNGRVDDLWWHLISQVCSDFSQPCVTRAKVAFDELGGEILPAPPGDVATQRMPENLRGNNPTGRSPHFVPSPERLGGSPLPASRAEDRLPFALTPPIPNVCSIIGRWHPLVKAAMLAR